MHKPLEALARTYDPRSYLVLEAWLDTLDEPGTAPRATLERRLHRSVHEVAPTVERAVEALGGFDAIVRARSTTRSRAAYLRAVHTYFDGFRTMKLVRSLRAAGLAPVPLRGPGRSWTETLDEARARDHARRARQPRVGVHLG